MTSSTSNGSSTDAFVGVDVGGTHTDVTVVTNTITTLRGSRVGVLITSGFKDAFRLAGGPRTTEIDDHLQLNVPDLMDRRAIAEIDERTDWSGSVLVSVDIEGVKAAAKH